MRCTMNCCKALRVERSNLENHSAATRWARGYSSKRIVAYRLDRREIAMRDPFGTGELGDVVGDRRRTSR